MEKRLFLAVGLSLLVVFLFQSFFAPKQQVMAPSDIATNYAKTVPNDGNSNSYSGLTADSVTAATPIEELITDFVHDGIKLKISNVGAKVKSVDLTAFDHRLPVAGYFDISIFDDKPFQLFSKHSNQIEFVYTGNDWTIRKVFRIESSFLIKSSIQITNHSSKIQTFSSDTQAFAIDTSSLDNRNGGADWTLFEYSIFSDAKVLRKNNASSFNEKWNKSEQDILIDFFGFRDRYFATIFKPGFELTNFYVKSKGAKQLSLGFSLKELTFLPSQTKVFESSIYIGPQKPELLQSAGKGFEKIFVFSDWPWLNALFMLIYWALGAMHRIIPIWGVCIIVISLVIYGLMYPLTLKSLVSMRKMQVVQPKIKKLQEKYKGSPEKLNQEVVLIYKQHGVNPLSGCLPMLLQMPIFIGLYQVLWRSFYFRGEGFLWMKDLSKPDHLFRLPFEIPFVGNYFNLLPILMVFIMSFQQRMSNLNSSADPEQLAQQKMMAMFFPIFIGFIFYNFSSGLNVYFVVFYLLSAFTQWHLSKKNFN